MQQVWQVQLQQEQAGLRQVLQDLELPEYLQQWMKVFQQLIGLPEQAWQV